MISGVVLAAGSSRRLGRPKQLLELEGRPVLQHVLDALGASLVDEVIVVLGHEAEKIAAAIQLPANGRTVVNAQHTRGQSTSLHAGLKAANEESEAAVIVLGDQPRLQPRTIDQVIEAFRGSRAPYVRAAYEGRPGHPLLAARSEWDALSAITGDKGARELITQGSAAVQEVESGGTPLQDLDTWEHYESLKRSGP